ncbi:MAG: NAD(+) synthase [Clostridia bacterium]|nr:NAD(+) synthase [Clostridia bacterium]
MEFNAETVRDTLVAQIRDLSQAQGFKRVVIGISGGKDSTVTAALCVRALGASNVYGIMMPDGEQADISDSRRVCSALHIPFKTVNIGEMHAALNAETGMVQDGETTVPYSKESDINVGPRLRMTVLRYITQALGGRLAGTGNLSERTVGYCTKDGDTSCDFGVLGNLTSIEVVKVGLTMSELPADLVEKTPSDGLSGMSDEEKMGVSYLDIHKFIRNGTCGKPDVDAKIAEMEKRNRHKQTMPPILDPFI